MFCNELIGWLRRYFRQLEISEETLALDLIHQIGPDGQFIDNPHTARHVREDWVPSLFDRLDHHRWSAQGATTLRQRANRKVRVILESHRAKPLPSKVQEIIESVTNR
jgi:trimethylamine--corrinoid protein Co-methyltransferase